MNEPSFICAPYIMQEVALCVRQCEPESPRYTTPNPASYDVESAMRNRHDVGFEAGLLWRLSQCQLPCDQSAPYRATGGDTPEEEEAAVCRIRISLPRNRLRGEIPFVIQQRVTQGILPPIWVRDTLTPARLLTLFECAGVQEPPLWTPLNFPQRIRVALVRVSTASVDSP